MQVQVTGKVARAAARVGAWCWRKVRALWSALPGPWWVKALLLALCLAIPGPGDEIALCAVAGVLAARKMRRSQ